MFTDDLSSHPHLPGPPILSRLNVFCRASPLHAFLRLLRRSHYSEVITMYNTAPPSTFSSFPFHLLKTFTYMLSGGLIAIAAVHADAGQPDR